MTHLKVVCLLKSFSITSKVIKVGEKAFINCNKHQILEITHNSELSSINFNNYDSLQSGKLHLLLNKYLFQNSINNDDNTYV